MKPYVRYRVQEGESTRFRVKSRQNPKLYVTYSSVRQVLETTDDNGNLCLQLCHSDGETSTFPISEWRVMHETFTDI